MPTYSRPYLETIEKLGFVLLEHPAYSPDIAHTDYYILEQFKYPLRVRPLATNVKA